MARNKNHAAGSNQPKTKKQKDFINVGPTERIISALGGAALTYYGLKKNKSVLGIGMATLGSSLMVRGATGYCPVNQALHRDTAHTRINAVEIKKSLTIYKYRHDVYNFWRHLENLPRFMRHLSEVKQLDNKRSHWVAKDPTGRIHFEWDAEITIEDENKLIAWHSLPGSEIENAGEVWFEEAPGGRGTEVHVNIYYWPPMGAIGKGIAGFINPALAQMVKEDIRQFKSIMESGEIPTIEGQPQGKR